MPPTDENAEPYEDSSADVQLGMFGGVDASNLTQKELAKPEAVALLISSWRITLHDLKAAQKIIERLRRENTQLRDSREEVRLELATLRERAQYSIFQILVGFMTGYAINRLAANIKDSLGWIALAVGSVMLLVLVIRSRSGGKQ